MIKMFLRFSHVIYICISLIFIFSIIRALDYPYKIGFWLFGLFTEVPMSPDNRGLTVPEPVF